MGVESEFRVHLDARARGAKKEVLRNKHTRVFMLVHVVYLVIYDSA